MADDGNKLINLIRSLRGEVKGLTDDLKTMGKAGSDSVSAMQGAAGGQSSSQTGNVSSSTTPSSPGAAPGAPGTGASGAPVAGSAGGAGAATGAPTAPISPAPNVTTGSPKYTAGFGQAIFGALSKAGGIAMAAAAILPTNQEAVGAQQLSDRIKFYTQTRKGGPLDGMNTQLYAAAHGTGVSPMDAALASNAALEYGLLPGLSNFAAGGYTTNSKTKKRSGTAFGGVMGSAALASNLAPGLGITGGMEVVGSINQAQNVNMLKMFGINTRGGDGSKPADLASIIDQLYKILDKSGTVNAENLAISAMPGNALDSIITQYFGTDPAIKNVIISGLVQKANTKGKSLYHSGTQAALLATGGLSSGAVSIGRRSASELKLIQSYTEPVVKGMVGANNALGGIYDFLEKGKNNEFVKSGLNAGVTLETLAGARNGAGAGLMNSLIKSDGLMTTATIAALSAGNLFDVDGFGGLLSATPNAANFGTRAKQNVSPATGPMYTGAITVNLQLPPGATDPYAYASALTQSMMKGVYS